MSEETVYMLKCQAVLLTNYLIDDKPSKVVVRRYVVAVRKFANININTQDERLLSIAFAHPWLLALLDAGLFWVNPNAELRRRIFSMLAILEATPEHAHKFLPTTANLIWTRILILAVRSASVSVMGVILVKALGVSNDHS